MDKTYNPKEYENKIYKLWEESGFFNPDNLPGERSQVFSIAMPPPNATGILHLGHATMLAIQDAVLRYKRMQGFKTLWIPGTDHAAIATQTKVEKIIAKEDLTRHDLGREKFLERVEKFVEESRSTIRSQIRQMGSSCDWSRERYTLDKGLSKSVQEIFVRMYNDGLIYRGNRIVNWCPRCQSTLSDDEVKYKEAEGKLYYIKYPIEKSDDFIIIATTRPETMLGDTAIAVNPKDSRYKNFIGKMIKLPLSNRLIPIISDDYVDMEFGTGALKITPAHDKDDFEVGKRHGLDVINILNNDGTLNDAAGEFAGLTINKARDNVIKKLESMKLVEKIDDYTHSVGKCYRCDAVVEPLISLQWFIDVDKKIPGKNKSLKGLSIEAVRSGKIKIIPERFEKIYFHWMENLHNWCISRQIWFGHRIPAYYCECGQTVVSLTPPTHCWRCNSSNFTQDPDTLDTWFSSGLWTFSTLGWPEETNDLKTYHPTSLLETGKDILFFWVARMILMSEYALGDIPFETVYLHGMVLDRNGKKMSKSKNTGIDPVDMIEKFGADALRISMLTGTAPGNDFYLNKEKISGYRNFVNKLWNISRFILLNCQNGATAENIRLSQLEPSELSQEKLTLSDKWILSELNLTINCATKNIEKYQLSQAGETLYDFTWNKLADWYLEISKIEGDKDSILRFILDTLLKLWHPFTPFVTETIWNEMNNSDLLIISKWPKETPIETPAAEIKKQFETIQKIIVSIRNTRAEYKIETKKNIAAIIETSENYISEQSEIIEKMARANISCIKESHCNNYTGNSSISIINEKTRVIIPLEGIVDTQKEKEKALKELASMKSYAKKLEKELSNKNFIANAPEKIVEQKKEQLAKTKEKIKKIEQK